MSSDVFDDFLERLPENGRAEIIGLSNRAIYDQNTNTHLYDLHTIWLKVSPTGASSDQLNAFAKPVPFPPEEMVFDWVKAARRIREQKPNLAKAYLQGESAIAWTNVIYANGQVRSEPYTLWPLACRYRPPVLEMDGIEEECWIYRSEMPEWDAQTYWPSAGLQALYAPVGGFVCTTGC